MEKIKSLIIEILTAHSEGLAWSVIFAIVSDRFANVSADDVDYILDKMCREGLLVVKPQTRRVDGTLSEPTYALASPSAVKLPSNMNPHRH